MDATNSSSADAAADRAASLDSAIFAKFAETATFTHSPNQPNAPPPGPAPRPRTAAETGAMLKAQDAARLHGQAPSADVSGQKAAQPQPQEPGHKLDAPFRGTSEDWSNEVNAFGSVAHGVGLSQDTAQRLVEFVNSESPKNSPLMRGGEWKQEQVRQSLRSEWGVDHDANFEHVAKAVKSGGQKLEAWLDSGPGDNPVVVKVLAALGKDPNFFNASAAQGKIDRVLNDQKHPYWQGNRQAVFEMSLLFQIAQQR